MEVQIHVLSAVLVLLSYRYIPPACLCITYRSLIFGHSVVSASHVLTMKCCIFVEYGINWLLFWPVYRYRIFLIKNLHFILKLFLFLTELTVCNEGWAILLSESCLESNGSWIKYLKRFHGIRAVSFAIHDSYIYRQVRLQTDV